MVPGSLVDYVSWMMIMMPSYIRVQGVTGSEVSLCLGMVAEVRSSHISGQPVGHRRCSAGTEIKGKTEVAAASAKNQSCWWIGLVRPQTLSLAPWGSLAKECLCIQGAEAGRY